MNAEAGFDRILAGLVEAGVDFVLIGGFALGSWGVIRGTKDVDIVAEQSPQNISLLAQAASDLGGHVQRAGGIASTPFSLASLLAGSGRVLIETALGPLDVVFRSARSST